MNETVKHPCSTASTALVFAAITQVFICSLGLILNSVTIRTVWKTRKRCKLFDNLLICLLLYDCLVLVTCPFFLFGIKHAYFRCSACAYVLAYVAFPIGHMGTFGTIFMTLAISHERYLAIRDPFHYNTFSKEDKDQRNRLLTYLIPATLLSFGGNIPRFFTFKVEFEDDKLELLLDLGCNENYLFYYTFLVNTIPFGAIPFLLLIYFGVRTFRRLQIHHGQFRRSSIYSVNEDLTRRQHEEGMAKVMVAIVAVYSITHFLRFFLHAMDGITKSRWNRCSKYGRHTGKEDVYLIVVGISIFMEIINSSMSPIIYCIIYPDFRREFSNRFKKLTTIWKRSKWHLNISNYYLLIHLIYFSCHKQKMLNRRSRSGVFSCTDFSKRS